MTFLELVKRVHQEAGLSGAGAASVKQQVGMDKKIVDWVRTAYQEIINLKPWDFTWTSKTLEIPAGVQVIHLADYGVTDVGIISRLMLGGAVVQIDDWKNADQLYANQPAGAVEKFAILPNGDLKLYPVPAALTNLTLEYHRGVHKLVENTDTPLIPEQFQMAIVFKALSLYAANDEAVALFQDAMRNYDNWMARLDLAQREQPQKTYVALDSTYINASSRWGNPWVLW